MSTQALGNVVIAIKAVDEATSVFGTIQGSMTILGGQLAQLGGGFATLGQVLTGFVAGGPAGAAIAGAGQIAVALKEAVTNAAESEQVFKNLGIEVEKSGTSWTSVEQKTRDYTMQLESTTAYSHDAIAGMITHLLTFGMTYDQAMGATGLALDLAAAKQMDTTTAADLMGKAFEGNASILKRYGIEIAASKDNAVVFAEALTQINAQFGGTAAAQAQTFTGSQAQLGNTLHDVSETVGQILIPALTRLSSALVPLIAGFGAWMDEVANMPDVKDAVNKMADALAGGVKDVGDLGGAFSDATKAVGDLLHALGVDMPEGFTAAHVLEEAFKDAWILLVEAPLKETTGILDAFTFAANEISTPLDTIRKAVESFLGALKADFQGFYDFLVGKSLWPDLWDALIKITQDMSAALLKSITTDFFDALNTDFNSLVTNLTKTWNGFTSGLGTDITSGISGAISGAQTGIQGLGTAISTGISGAISGAQTSIQGLGTTISTGLSGLASTASTDLTGLVSLITAPPTVTPLPQPTPPPAVTVNTTVKVDSQTVANSVSTTVTKSASGSNKFSSTD